MKHPAWAHRLFSDEDLDAIATAVAEAERQTSGEIRVHLERSLVGRRGEAPDVLTRARDVFATLGMHKTVERNAVLIYLAVEDRKLAIVGDDGVHARVGSAYWEHVRDVMVANLREGAPRVALLAAIADVGSLLRRYFPRRPDDLNELSDRVSAS